MLNNQISLPNYIYINTVYNLTVPFLQMFVNTLALQTLGMAQMSLERSLQWVKLLIMNRKLIPPPTTLSKPLNEPLHPCLMATSALQTNLSPSQTGVKKSSKNPMSKVRTNDEQNLKERKRLLNFIESKHHI